VNRERDEKEVGSVIGLPQRALASLSGPIAICVLTFFALGLVGDRARGEDKQAVADWPVWLAEAPAGAPPASCPPIRPPNRAIPDTSLRIRSWRVWSAGLVRPSRCSWSTEARST
jgi:hypothetical protein